MNLSEDEIIKHRDLLINVFDRQHHILFWNKKCEDFFSIKEEDALGKRIEELLPHTRNYDKMARLDEALSGKHVFITDDKYDTKDYYYTQIIFPLKNHKEEVIAAVNIVRLMPCTESVVNQKLNETSQLSFAGYTL